MFSFVINNKYDKFKRMTESIRAERSFFRPSSVPFHFTP